LKAGGAYLPIDPRYPQERIDFILNDSSAKVLLTQDDISLEEGSRDVTEYIPPLSTQEAAAGTVPAAYVIYTSGSTGRPKGVIVEHKNVVRLVKNTDFIRFQPDDRILQTGALEFDASTFEIWGALLNGLTLYLTARENILNTGTLKKTIAGNRITIMWLTSPLFNQIVQ
ncbi:MAG: AMP-binding protein, partial [bacterium]|nr:AMP-binding protein [bacterium]